MALPQKALEQLSREPVRTPGWSGRLLMFTSTLFVVSLAIYFGLSFGYQPYLEGNVTKLDLKVEKLIREIPPEEQEKLIDFYSQIVNLRSILDAGRLTSFLFPWVEANTHVDVSLLSFSVNMVKSQISLAARGRTIEAVGEQVSLLEKLPEVKKVNFGGTSVDKDGFWAFGLILTLEEDFLRRTGFAGVPPAPPPGAPPAAEPVSPPSAPLPVSPTQPLTQPQPGTFPSP